MTGTLAGLAASDAPLRERLRAVRELAAAAAALAARGKVHGGLAPDAVAVLEGGAVALRPASGRALARAGFDAPEVARGARPSRRSDAFAVGALAWLALAGRGPFEAEEPFETVRRVLHAEAEPVRIHAPGVPVEVEAAIAALLEKHPRRRAGPGELVAAIDAATSSRERERARASTPTATSTSTPTPTSTPTGIPARTPTPRSIPALPSLAPLLGRCLPVLSRLARASRSPPRALERALRAARALPPLPRTALAFLPVIALSLAVFPHTDAALARSVAERLERGDVAGARALVDEAARSRPSDPVVEKLRGDVACARGAPGECLRRYRVAIASREELREDPALRANARRLVERTESCGTRRAAAQLLGELRDPEALPALEEARRSGGIFAAFCTGDAIDRAIAATRAEARL